MSVPGLTLDYPACFHRDFPDDLPLAELIVGEIAAEIPGTDLEPLAVHSPGAALMDWPNYLHCSLIRMAHVRDAVRRRGVLHGRVLDYGSYFGNFSRLFAATGFGVDAIDAYGAYGSAMARAITSLERHGITTLDFAAVGTDLAALPAASYDVVLAMGVIEHIPHTPRPFLESLNRVLRPGGLLLGDTPNHAYLYNRQALARGDSIMAPIAAQFASAVPFEGHHREYTASELAWMRAQIGHDDITVEMFNYSAYGLPVIEGRDLDNFYAMIRDPFMRELALCISRRPQPDSPLITGWRLEERETCWEDLVPADAPPAETNVTAVLAADREVARLVEEIARLNALIAERPLDRAKRVFRRWLGSS